MGADIYLNGIGKHFRNSYNDSDVMWAMGLSWWGTVGLMLDPNGRLPVQRARELLALIEERPLTEERLTEHCMRNMCAGGGEPPTTDPFEILAVSSRELPEGTGLCFPAGIRLGPLYDVWTRFLRRRREDLIAILRKSIERDEPLDCSL